MSDYENVKLSRSYNLVLTNYCTGGCDYCYQGVENKSRRDTDEELQDSLQAFSTFIENLKKDYPRISKYYDLAFSVLGGELAEAPSWFQKELIPLIRELHNYGTIVFFSNGTYLRDSILYEGIKELKNIHVCIHLTHWMKHPYNYWVKYYTSFIKKENLEFTLVIRPEEYSTLYKWYLGIPDNSLIPIVINAATSSKEIPSEMQDLFDAITRKTVRYITLWRLPQELRKLLCYHTVKHGGGLQPVIEGSLKLKDRSICSYICCGTVPGEELVGPEALTTAQKLSPSNFFYVKHMHPVNCKQCTNIQHLPYKLMNAFMHEDKLQEALDYFRDLEINLGD